LENEVNGAADECAGYESYFFGLHRVFICFALA
jgi:hypothetical protein